MPAISTRFPTTTRSTYLPSTTSSIGDTLYRRSSQYGSYRSVNGDDSPATSSRFGTSVSKRYTSTTSIPSSPTSTIATSSLTRKSIDRDYRDYRDYRSKPPLGSRLRSESRFRDLSLDNGYTNSSNIKTNLDSSLSLSYCKRLSTTSLARSVATSGADLYEKYSVANYKPNCELSRSRSLTDSKLIDSISANHHSSTRPTSRSTSKDRSTTTGSLLAGSASTKDYLSNRSTSPVSSGLKVKTKDTFCGVSSSLANSRCLYSNSPSSSPIPNTNTTSNSSVNNNNNNINTNLNNKSSKNNRSLKASLTQKHNNILNNNDNPLSDSIVVSSTSITNPNNSKNCKKLHISSIDIGAKSGAIKKSSTKASSTPVGHDTKVTAAVTNGNAYKSMNGTISHNVNNNNNETKLMSSESFKRRLGTNPLSPYNNPEFLKCEYDLARSQVVNSRSKSATGEKNNNNLSDRNKSVNGGYLSSSVTSSPAKDLNRNKITIDGVNSASSQQKLITSHTNDKLKSSETIKSSLTDNNNSSGNMTMNCVGTAKKFGDIYTNKYNTITNGSCAHQANGIHIGNGIARKAVPEEMLSSASSSTSTLSAMTESSTSSLLPKNSTKDSNAPIKQNHLENGDNKISSVRSTLPPTPSRFDRDSKTSSISSRILPDTDAFTKSLAASSISDRTTDDDDTEGLCGLRNIGNTCFMNSIIQCLSHTKDLTRYLKTKVDVRSSNVAKDSRIVTEFSKLIKEMWSGSSRSVTPSELKSAFSSKHRMYSGCSQQDAQEFLRFFLDALHVALNAGTKGEKLEIDESLSNNSKADIVWEWYSKVENSVIKDLFVGQLKSSLKCTVCGNTSVTFDPLWDLSVPLPTSSRCKLESCLDLFIKEEVLDGDEMPTGSKCKTRRKSTKSFTIQRFPKYLAIHLKRFSETRWSKLSNIVEFPTGERELNMAPYAANSTTVQYSLYGICNHMGEDVYNDYYENYTDSDMTNSTAQDHRQLTEWSQAGGDSATMPLDMTFNDGHRLSIIVYSILMVLSSIGNITVLVLLLKRRFKRPSRIDTMLTHLAIADLLVTFFMMPLEIGWAFTVSWKAGDFMCRLMSFLRTFGLYLSSFVLVCISVDRYFAVIKPMKLADRRGKIMLFIAWISSCVCSTPQAIIFHLENHPNVTHYQQCVTYNFFQNEFHEIIYSFIGMVLMYALPLIIIVFCYASIYIELYKKSKKCVTDRFRRSNDDVLGRAKRKTLRMTITIVIVFIVCWTPFYVMSIWYWFDKETAMKVDQRIQKGLFLFACTNSCMNPIVYGLYNIPRRTNKNDLRNSHVLHASMSKPSDSDFSRRNSIANSVRKSVCVNCGEAIELPNLRIHKTLYH